MGLPQAIRTRRQEKVIARPAAPDGYGHSRLREFILGGATRGMLESMTVQALMSH